MQTAANGVPVSEMVPGKRLADQRSLRGGFAVPLIEQPPRDQRNPHGLAIAGADCIAKYGVSALRILVVKLSTILAHHRGIIAKWQEACECGGFDARHVSHSFERLLEEVATIVSTAGIRCNIIELMS